MSRKRNDSICPARFLLDLFVFSTLMNEISCHSNRNPTNELKISNGKRSEIFERFCRFCPRLENQTIQNGNPEGNFVFDKMLHWIFDEKEMEKGTEKRERSFKVGETFSGQGRRLRLAILPIMYKMGVMTTMLTGLMVLAAKGLAVGLMLLMFAVGNHFFKHGKDSNHSYQQPPIHVHVHSDSFKSGHYVQYKEPETEVSIDPWDRKEVQEKYFKPKDEMSWESYQR